MNKDKLKAMLESTEGRVLLTGDNILIAEHVERSILEKLLGCFDEKEETLNNEVEPELERWEYLEICDIDLKFNRRETLNELGHRGWNLIYIKKKNGEYYYLFKRRIK